MSSLGIRFQRSPVTESVTGEPPLRLPTMPADAVIAGHQFTQGLEGCRFVARRAGFFCPALAAARLFAKSRAVSSPEPRIGR